VRWWNVKHPAAYAQRISSHHSPAAARESLDPETRRVERVLLETRLSSGLALDVLDAAGRAVVPDLLADGLVTLTPVEASVMPAEGSAVPADRSLVLTRRGRLLADAVVRALLP
jgi:oxygen-independent coproporphyrinogen-3 oxidase